MHLDLTDLRLFLLVHEAGTITGGAQAAHMTLASASERIQGMEASVGVPLLVREPRGVRPTPAGRTLIHHARLVLAQMERLKGEMGEHGAGLVGQVRLLCNTSALHVHLPEVLARFLSRHPGVSLELRERASGEIVRALRHGLCDVGVASDAADREGLESFPLCPDPLALIVPAGHALAARDAASLAEALEGPFVGLTDDSALQALVSAQASRLGRSMSPRIRVSSLESVCRMVGLGVGAAVVPEAVAARDGEAAGVRRLRLADAWAARHLVVCTRARDELPPAARQLVEHLLQDAGAAARHRSADRTAVGQASGPAA